MAYCDTAALYIFGIRADALVDVPSADQEEALEAASETVDGYLRTAGYGVPIPTASLTRDIKRAVCRIAAWDLLSEARGFAPSSSSDVNSDLAVRTNYEDAIAWLRDVAKGVIQPIPLNSSGANADATPDAEEGGAVVVTEESRGWAYP